MEHLRAKRPRELAPLTLRCAVKLNRLGVSVKGLVALGILPDDLPDYACYARTGCAHTISRTDKGNEVLLFRWKYTERDGRAPFLLFDEPTDTVWTCFVCRTTHVNAPDAECRNSRDCQKAKAEKNVRRSRRIRRQRIK